KPTVQYGQTHSPGLSSSACATRATRRPLSLPNSATGRHFPPSVTLYPDSTRAWVRAEGIGVLEGRNGDSRTLDREAGTAAAACARYPAHVPLPGLERTGRPAQRRSERRASMPPVGSAGAGGPLAPAKLLPHHRAPLLSLAVRSSRRPPA